LLVSCCAQGSWMQLVVPPAVVLPLLLWSCMVLSRLLWSCPRRTAAACRDTVAAAHRCSTVANSRRWATGAASSEPQELTHAPGRASTTSRLVPCPATVAAACKSLARQLRQVGLPPAGCITTLAQLAGAICCKLKVAVLPVRGRPTLRSAAVWRTRPVTRKMSHAGSLAPHPPPVGHVWCWTSAKVPTKSKLNGQDQVHQGGRRV